MLLGDKSGVVSNTAGNGTKANTVMPPPATPAVTPARKNSGTGAPRTGTPHLNRSQDNLASQLRKRAVAEKQQNNKENGRN